MAVPALLSFPDTVDWSKTVEPYIPQLYELPSKLVDVLQSRQNIVDLYLHTNPLISGLGISILLGAVFLVVAEINKNYSQIRLTFNYWRKGGYQIGSEDYRWEIIQSKVPWWAFTLLNITFISFTQSVLLFSLAAPAYPILLSIQFQPDLTWLDIVFTIFQVGLITTEWFADQQQWDFQNAKKEYQATGKAPQGFAEDDLKRGFITSGLWAWSRHPNFAVEQSIWLTLGVWSIVTAEVPYAWTLIPGFSLVSLFQGSTWLTELITAGKYPEYKDYQRQVGMFAPNVLGFGPYRPPQPQTKALKEKKQK
ncbi:hypothetical protein INS49_006839 [Diaporthe citri]|uniref:uncharacterized protein n=1 Tax=Diaporthe citri TaxID=83186 RepID=UPI001C80426A|nr:uncharacterized protein INS49_006839 [Diaporthe citri]KAG6365230.1 hypothetical protein INS49_006839 [Diaporthe citri]